MSHSITSPFDLSYNSQGCRVQGWGVAGLRRNCGAATAVLRRRVLPRRGVRVPASCYTSRGVPLGLPSHTLLGPVRAGHRPHGYSLGPCVLQTEHFTAVTMGEHVVVRNNTERSEDSLFCHRDPSCHPLLTNHTHVPKPCQSLIPSPFLQWRR